jgi:cbb3-type cytochrome oxidase subunit 1
MSVSRGFMLGGTIYLLVGISLGAYMGASGDHSLTPVHAHINLLGFVLMTVFGLAYRLVPGLGDGTLPKAHFWLHLLGSLGLLIALTLLITGRAAESVVGPIMPVFEGAVLLGVVLWLVGLFRHA